MPDPIVTYADLDAVSDLRAWLNTRPTGIGHWPEQEARKADLLALLDRLIAAAEADQPPLPEGWVVYTPPSGKRRILWHENGALHIYDDGRSNGGVYIDVKHDRDRLTPLRPTVTEADFMRALTVWQQEAQAAGGAIALRAAFAAAGVVIEP